MIQTASLRNNLLCIGIREYARDAASNAAVLKALLQALGHEIDTIPQQLAAFQTQMDAPGAHDRANYALLVRTVGLLEAKLADYTLLREAVRRAASSKRAAT